MQHWLLIACEKSPGQACRAISSRAGIAHSHVRACLAVPLIYTRHTGRFLGLWVLFLPLALAREMCGSVVMIPVCTVVGMLFFGIEELGVQIEEPFSILPLEDYVANVETAASQMLAQESQCDVQGGELVIGADAVPMTEFMTVYVSEPPS